VGAREAQAVFPTLEATGMRGRVLQYELGFTVINDCYNSNPVALVAMIGLLTSTPATGRHILAAGEMLELGSTSAELHREAGRSAVTTGKLDWIIGVQGDAENLVRGAMEAGHPAAQAKFFASSAEAGAFLEKLMQRGDVLLVKGSRGVKMERIVEALDSRFARSQADSTVTVASGTPKERA
jgi:UDP-N-acetylmuramoyl-tripeptide--D-alanyl-D-alanine ligase